MCGKRKAPPSRAGARFSAASARRLGEHRTQQEGRQVLGVLALPPGILAARRPRLVEPADGGGGDGGDRSRSPIGGATSALGRPLGPLDRALSPLGRALGPLGGAMAPLRPAWLRAVAAAAALAALLRGVAPGCRWRAGPLDGL